MNRGTFGQPIEPEPQHDCPDCLSDTVLEEVEPGIWRAVILHDDGCPAYARRAARIHRARAAIRRHEKGEPR